MGNDRLCDPIEASLSPDRPRVRSGRRVLDAAPLCGRNRLPVALADGSAYFFGKFSSHFPSTSTVCVNGHGYGQYQFAKRGVGSTELDNRLLDCAKPEQLCSTCAEVTAEHIDALRHRGWYGTRVGSPCRTTSAASRRANPSPPKLDSNGRLSQRIGTQCKLWMLWFRRGEPVRVRNGFRTVHSSVVSGTALAGVPLSGRGCPRHPALLGDYRGGRCFGSEGTGFPGLFGYHAVGFVE